MNEKDENGKDPDIIEETLENFMPGLGKTVKKLKSFSPELDERLKEKNAEIKNRLRDGGSHQPKVKYGYSIRTLAPEKEEADLPGAKPQLIEVPLETIEEDGGLRVIAEMPGVDEKDIKTLIRKTELEIEARFGKRLYKNSIVLPWPATIVNKRYMNGILEVKVVRDRD